MSVFRPIVRVRIAAIAPTRLHPGRWRCARSASFPLIIALAIAPLSRSDAQLPVAAPSDIRDTVRLTIAEARARAIRLNPDLAAATLDIEIARGQFRQAATLRFNPATDLLGSGSSGSRPEIGVSQELEIAGQRGVRRDVARAAVARATFSVSNVLRVTVADVERGFYRAVVADRRVELNQEVLALTERLAQVAIRQLREGEISKLDYNLSVVERGRARARAFAARREQQQSVIELRRLVGMSATEPVSAVFDSTVHRHAVIDSSGALRMDLSAFGALGDSTSGQLIARAIERRPDLAERSAAVAQAEAAVTLARREALPNLMARVLSQQNAVGSGSGLRPGIGLSLPLFNRNQGEIESRRAGVRQAALERVAMTARIRADVEGSLRAYQAAAGEIEVLESTVLGPARENRRLLETAYREGKVGLAVLLLIRNQVIDAEQEYWTAWLSEREAAAELAASVGASTSANLPRSR